MQNKFNFLFSALVVFLLLSINSSFLIRSTATTDSDFDPLVDITVTFTLDQIRSLEKDDGQVHSKEYIDKYSAPDFYLKVWINDDLFESPVWRNTRYNYNPEWEATCNVPDDEEIVNIKIQLWDWNIGVDTICDISKDNTFLKDAYDVEISYSIKYGVWWGDDCNCISEPISLDQSGYGRLNGCDDGSIYQRDRDVELWFTISQNDIDGDGVPYWMEVNEFNTDPEIDDSQRDDDNDGIPLAWEYFWGHQDGYDYHSDEYYHEWIYHPFEYNDHYNLDPDNDGLSNYEEYLTSQWFSDPFRKDLFVELDHMDVSPDGKESNLPDESKELLRTVYDRQNIVYHLDDGCMDGGEIIPFEEVTTYNELQGYYQHYFLHNDENNWRKGVFHYGLVIYEAEHGPGFVFRQNAYQISSTGMDKKCRLPWTSRTEVYASAYMHECGHTLGIFNGNTPGCDDHEGKYPWELNWWKWRPYKSVMNYGYMYLMVDYSDGSRGKNDFDDWNRIDLGYFQR
jgi:hypothetical protein